MVPRIPIVVGDSGQPEQLLPGDLLNAKLYVGPTDPKPVEFVFSGLNFDFAVIFEGAVCAVHSSGQGLIRAIASNALASGVGIAQRSISPGQTGYCQTDGIFELQDWTSVIGQVNLFPRGYYFLDPNNPGRMTTTPPTMVGQILQFIGQAVSPKKLSLAISQAILL